MATENRFTGQKLDGSGLYYYNARYYDPQLGTFLSPDTLVPDPTNLFDYNRYMYTRGNPLKYNDPSGHTGIAVHDSNAGPPMLLQNDAFYKIQEDYYNLGVDWDDLPSDVRQSYENHGTTRYVNMGGNAASQEGTIGEPALWGASVFAGWRLVTQLPGVVMGACLDDGCVSEYRTYEMATKRFNPSVSLQKMAGVVSDSLRHAKGFHINAGIPGAELGLQPGRNGTILLRALGETKVNPGDYIDSVRILLSQQQDKVIAQLNGIISTHQNTWVAQEAQQLINIINQGNFTIVAQ